MLGGGDPSRRAAVGLKRGCELRELRPQPAGCTPCEIVWCSCLERLRLGGESLDMAGDDGSLGEDVVQQHEAALRQIRHVP